MEPSKDKLKKLANLDTPTFDKNNDEPIQGNRVLETKEVKNPGDYTVKGISIPDKMSVLEVVGNCPACGEMFMGKIEDNSKKMPCTNEDCEYDLFMKDRKLFCQKRIIES